MTFTLSFTRRYSMAHRLIGGASVKCAVPHGHNEVVVAHLQPQGNACLDLHDNMVVEFQEAKSLWHEWIDQQVDHALQLSQTDPLLNYFKVEEPEKLQRILLTPGDPTTELLAVCFKAKLQSFLTAQALLVQCSAIEITETPTNQVTFSGDPYSHLPRQGWWARSDMSINDWF